MEWNTIAKAGKGSEHMKYRTIYRICLFAVIILTLAGGIFYYVNYVQQQDTVTEGTLVKERQKPEAADEALGGNCVPWAVAGRMQASA